MDMKSLFQYFEGHLKSSRIEKRTLSARLRLLLKKFNTETPWSKIPEGPLIVIADGLIQFFKGKKYTVYFLLFRSIEGQKAFIFPPYMRAGGEIVLGWEEAFSLIPDEIFHRIEALVCDGHGGLVRLARKHQWILQRCHFHLLARIAHNVSFGPLGKTRDFGIRIRRLVQIVLYQENISAVFLALEALEKIYKTITSRNFKTVISGFLNHYSDFRAYLKFPKYFLPITSNSAEFLNAQIRRLQYRARGFRTPQSLFSWIQGFCKYQKFITCRGKNQPN